MAVGLEDTMSITIYNEADIQESSDKIVSWSYTGHYVLVAEKRAGGPVNYTIGDRFRITAKEEKDDIDVMCVLTEAGMVHSRGEKQIMYVFQVLGPWIEV